MNDTTLSTHQSTKKPLFQNFIKQKPDLSKGKHLNIKDNNKTDQDINLLSQFTIDLTNPKMTSSFAGVKVGKNKASPQINKQTTINAKTPKNYSLQLNQVVKKILGEGQFK